ncbi:MAG: hypothetical protein JXR18_16165 [Neptuniibacter sp.]
MNKIIINAASRSPKCDVQGFGNNLKAFRQNDTSIEATFDPDVRCEIKWNDFFLNGELMPYKIQKKKGNRLRVGSCRYKSMLFR